MKRSLILLGLFLPFTHSTTPIARQHYVRPTKRKVKYGKSHIPSSVNIAHNDSESTTHNEKHDFKSYHGIDDDWWIVHVDALHEHPDHIHQRIDEKYSKGKLHNGETPTSLKTDSSIFRWFSRALKTSTSNIIDRAIPANIIAFSETTVYNVSFNTEYNVSFRSSMSGNESTSQQNDTFTVTLTTSNSSLMNSSRNEDVLDDDTSAMSNSTLSVDRKIQYQPLRIRSFLSNLEGGGSHLSITQRSILLQDILKPALLAWSAALRVNPVIGNLTVDSNQLVAGSLCGPGGDLPAITVPSEHIIFGVPNTDFILYLHLSFVFNQTKNTTEYDDSNSNAVFNTTNELNDNAEKTYSNTTVSQHYAVNDTRTIKRYCSGDYLAASSFCSTDQFDRPTAGIIHICIGPDFFRSESIQRNILLVSHELGHVFGFNAISLAHFRRRDGTPYTDRDPNTGEIPLTEINCTGPLDETRTGKVHLPSNEVLQFRIVRGGVRVAEIVTPSVRQVVRNHFDCQSLPGAELESGDFLPLSSNYGEISCIGDHWERRLFKTDIMNPLIDDNVEFTTRFSTITLAYFADSGWYQVDLSRASLSAGWGRAAGCNFVEQTCVNVDNGQVPSNFNSFFCNEVSVESNESGYTSDIHGCTTDLTRKASCSVDHYEGELPPAYQYFNVKYGTNVGGVDPFMDYCPVYTGFSNGLCSDSQNEALVKVNYIERFGQKNSRCLSGRMARDVANSEENGQNTSEAWNLRTVETTALCLPIACVVEDRTLRIQVNGVWMVCNSKDDVLVTPNPSTFLSVRVSSVICPDPIRVCPTFYCQRDCLGTSRMCDYSIGKCVCRNTASQNLSISEFGSSDGKNFANIPVQGLNDTDTMLCMASNSSEGESSSTTESFYKPNDTASEYELPTSDSPLSDYYYKTERNLKEESSTNFWAKKWKGILSASGSFVFFSLISFFSYQVYCRHFRSKEDTPPDDLEDILSGNDETVNPNKDKLMASIVVNIRMNDRNLQGSRGGDPLSNRDSETVLSMTDTDGVSDIFGSLDCSLELPSTIFDDGGTIVDLTAYDSSRENESNGNGSGLYEEVASLYIDPLAAPTNGTQVDKKTVVRRRRQLFSRIQ